MQTTPKGSPSPTRRRSLARSSTTRSISATAVRSSRSAAKSFRYEQVRYERSYPFGGVVAQGQGNAIDRSLDLFARVGWVDRVTPRDEAAIYTDLSRSWLFAGGYTEAAGAHNPFPATVLTGLEGPTCCASAARYTHLFGGQVEANVSAAVAYGFDWLNSVHWNVADYGLVAANPIGNYGLVRMGCPSRLSRQPAHGHRRLPARDGRRPGRHDTPRRHRPALSLRLTGLLTCRPC